MHVKLYEDIARHGRIATTYNYPVMVEGATSWPPRRSRNSTIPRCDMQPALQLFGAGREKRIYAVPPYTAGRRASISRTIRSRSDLERVLRAVRRQGKLPRRGDRRRPRRAHVRLLGHRPLRERRADA
jgi:hypothetical protein